MDEDDILGLVSVLFPFLRISTNINKNLFLSLGVHVQREVRGCFTHTSHSSSIQVSVCVCVCT